jgi:cell division protein FtsB
VASLKQRQASLADENRGLRQEIKDLKTELALAYGARRGAGAHRGDDRPVRAS